MRSCEILSALLHSINCKGALLSILKNDLLGCAALNPTYNSALLHTLR